MTFRRAVLWLSAAVVAATESHAQVIPRFPIPARRRPSTPPRERENFTYERPMISPWVGFDFGTGGVIAKCDCSDVRGGVAAMGSLAAGATFFSRFTIAAERTGMDVLFFDFRTGGKMTTFSGRTGFRRGRFGVNAKGGYGKGRFKEEAPPKVLVDEQAAWMLGAEACGLDQIDACFFADHSWTRLGAPTSDPPIGRYRMKVIRFGYAVRVHVLHGRKLRIRRPNTLR
jgi:hypothetical protein